MRTRFTPMLLIQCIGIVGALVTQTATHVNMRGKAPDANLLAVDIVWIAFVGWWIGSVLWLRWQGRIAEDTPDGWYFHSLGIFWSGNTATLFSFFLLTPYGSLDWLLLGCAFCLAPMVLEAVGTVRTPRFGPRPMAALLVPAVLPVIMGSWLLMHAEPRAREMGFFYFLFLVMLLFLRELIQGVVNQLEAARNDAERERDARTRFLAAVSHDMAQPMMAARLFFEQVIRLPLGEARDAAVRNAMLAFDSTEDLLDQILQRMRLDAGALKPSLQRVCVDSALTRAAERAKPIAALHGIELRCVRSNLEVLADPALLDRILGNLLGNALRHSRATRVLLGARRSADRVTLWVIDDGIGIPEADRNSLFKPFASGRHSARTSPEGLGIGLSSSLSMAQLMGASLDLAPAGLRGAAFCLVLPRA